MTTREVLDQIEHVLADSSVSRDAMRWRPDPDDQAPAAADAGRQA